MIGKQTVKITMLVAAVGLASLLVVPVPVASALKCNGVETSLISCPDGQQGSCSDGSKPVNATCPNSKDPDVKYIPPNDITKSGIWSLLLMGINILTVGVGIAAVGGILWGSLLFLTAAGSPEQFKKARMVIWNVVVGIVVYAVMYALLNFLIPGGLFS